MTALARLVAQVEACRLCEKHLPLGPRPVVRASTTARVLIVGQAPGTKVHASGIPWNDRSGDRLRDWLAVDRDTFYDARRIAIMPMGFCYPGVDKNGGDAPPRPECAPAWRARLLAEMPGIALVICLGAHAMRWHMREHWPGSVDAAVKDWRIGLALTPAVIPLPHPSWRNSGWLKRNPWFAAELLPELRARVARLLAAPA